MDGTAAARLNDPIAHTNAHARFWAKFAGGLIGGIVVGAAAGAAAVAMIGTGGAAAPLVVAAAIGVARFGGGLAGGFAGEWIADKLVPETVTVTGMVSTASFDVFINSKARGAARASPDVPIDMALCSKHSPPIYLAEGAETVFVNTWVMSRKDDHTTCGAKISEGSPDVIVGGPTARVRDVADEVPLISKIIVTVFSVVMLARGIRCLPKLARQGRTAVPCLVEGALSAGVGVWGLVSSLGNPVIAATGGKVLAGEADLDFVLPGPISLAWQRFYSSHDVRSDSMLGQGWSHPFSMELVLGSNNKGEPVATLFDQQGRDIEFPQLEPGTGVYSQSEGYWLWRSEGGRYFSQSVDGEYCLFEPVADAAGEQHLKLLLMEDRNSNFIELRWNALRQLHQITDSTGRLLGLRYDTAARLAEVSIVTPAPDESPGVLVRYKYDPTGQLVEVWDRTDQLVRRFDYNADHLMTLHADAAGLECRYEWQGQGRWARVVRHWTNDGESYDISYRMLAQSPAEGASEPNAVAGYTTAVDQLGRVQTWAWNDEFCVLSYTNPLGATWRATYDELKQRLSLVAPNGGTTTYRYDELGLPTAETDVLGRTWSTSWTPLGLPWMETAPDGSVDRFAYDDHGNLTRHTAPDSSETHFVYDNRGLPLRVTDAKGGVKRLRWSVRAQMLEYTDCSAQSTQYAYDGSGHLSRVTDALGHITEFTHDPNGKLRAQSLPDGAHLSYGWDAASRLVQSRDALSRSTRFAWNLRGQLTMREDGEGRRVALEYDGARRLARLTNENGESFAFEYNAGDQLIAEHRIGGQRVTVDYDVAGWPVAVTHVPALGDDMLLEGGARTEGHTPEISGWGDKLAAPTAASGPQPCRTDLIRDAAGRLLEKRTASHHYHYRYDAVDQLLSATKLQVLGQQVGPTGQPQFNLKPLHTTTFEYDLVGNLVAETATDAQTGQSHTLRHSHDPLGNRTQTQLPTLPGQPYLQRALNYLHYGSGHLHQINYSQRDTRSADALAVHQLISDIERDALHRETARSQGQMQTRYALDPLGRRQGAWSQPIDQRSRPYQASDTHWQRAVLSAGTPEQNPFDGLMKAYAYDKVGELRQSRHSLRGDIAHQYDATGRIEHTVRQLFGTSQTPHPTQQNAANNERFQYDPAGNILDNQAQAALRNRTQHLQEGYVRDNLVRVYEDKRYAYDGHGRLIQKLSGKHTAQTFEWDEESRLTAVTTTRRPGTEHETTQTTRFDYDAIGRRVAKHDSFGTTVFIWEGMRLIEERRGSAAISYVYEPDSYVPLARLDAEGERTEQGGLGTTQDAQQLKTSKNIAAGASQTSAGGQKDPKPQAAAAANDPETQYWAALASQGSHRSQDDGSDANATAQAPLCEVYYFHTDQVGLPEELSNAQGQIIWQAQYKTWGSTVEERWEARRLHGAKVQGQTEGDIPQGDRQEQNLRFQGQYLDRETGLHYNTFRYYDADIGRFISPDPIGLEGGINLGSYSPNPISWIDPWGWVCIQNKVTGTARERRVTAKLEGVFGKGNVLREKTLRDSSGKKVTGPDGTGRRVDNVVLGADGKPKYVIEVTSKTADKTAQQLKEASIRNKGGTYIRDSKGVLHDISGIPTRTIRVE